MMNAKGKTAIGLAVGKRPAGPRRPIFPRDVNPIRAGGITLSEATGKAVDYARDNLGYFRIDVRDYYRIPNGWMILLSAVTNPGWEERNLALLEETRKARRRRMPKLEREQKWTWGMAINQNGIMEEEDAEGNLVRLDGVLPMIYWKRKADAKP